MALVKGKFVDKDLPIQSNNDPVDEKDLARKGYVDSKAAAEAAAAVAALDLSAKADLVDGKVPSSQLPGYVDDVEEYADLASFPAEGSAGKLYVAQDTNKVYRWSGTVYIEIAASPGSTDAVPEGSVNLYFTDERAKLAVVRDELDFASTDTAPSQRAIGEFANGRVSKAGDEMTGNLLMNGQLVKNLGAPVDDNDAARKKYVDDALAGIDLSGKADLVHTHVAADITDFASAAEAALSDELALKQNSLGTGTTSQYLRGDLTWQSISAQRPAKVFTVGIDANTIAGCIALCVSPTATNNYLIEIPSGTYTEDLTIPGNVHLKGLANPNDSLTVKIVGQHTITGASNNALNNRVAIANILFVSTHATTPLFAISGALAETEVQMTGCFLQHSSTASTAKLFNLGLFGKLYINNSRTRLPASSQGGTHFTMAAGSSLYSSYGLDMDGGTCAIDMTGQAYAQMQYAQVGCSGASAIKIAANGMVILSQSSLTNGAAVGNGVNMLGANASFFANHSAFNIQENAGSFVVTGVAGSVYGFYSSNYSHIPGVIVRNTKIGPSVTQLRYASSMSSADIGDFQSAARTAAVADAITNGVTNVAPSQNAVFDALALKLSLSGGTMSGILAMGSQKITGLANGSDSNDAVNKGQLDAAIAAVPAGLAGKKETKTLSAGDITNRYVDCAFLAAADTMLVMSGGVVHIEGESYTLSTVGGVTRITFIGDLVDPSPSKLEAGDKVHLMYMK